MPKTTGQTSIAFLSLALICNEQDKTKIKVKDPSLYPCKNLIIESFRTIIEYDAEDYQIVDENDQEITLEELADRYYNNPGEYFEKDFEGNKNKN